MCRYCHFDVCKIHFFKKSCDKCDEINCDISKCTDSCHMDKRGRFDFSSDYSKPNLSFGIGMVSKIIKEIKKEPVSATSIKFNEDNFEEDRILKEKENSNLLNFRKLPENTKNGILKKSPTIKNDGNINSSLFDNHEKRFSKANNDFKPDPDLKKRSSKFGGLKELTGSGLSKIFNFKAKENKKDKIIHVKNYFKNKE